MKRNREGGGSLKIVIKFCGGCNPRIRREELANRLADRLSPLQVGFLDPASGDLRGDTLCILINGCPSACGSPPPGLGEEKVLRVSGPYFAGRERKQEELPDILNMKVREHIELEGPL